jgi:hypothetical protein
MAQAPQDEESGMIINFLDELAANHAADVEVLELSGRIAQLKAANTQFIDLLSKRRTETATKPARRMVEIRREGNGLIRMLYAQIDLLQRTSPTADITAFANEINAENARVNANLRRG